MCRQIIFSPYVSSKSNLTLTSGSISMRNIRIGYLSSALGKHESDTKRPMVPKIPSAFPQNEASQALGKKSSPSGEDNSLWRQTLEAQEALVSAARREY